MEKVKPARIEREISSWINENKVEEKLKIKSEKSLPQTVTLLRQMYGRYSVRYFLGLSP